MKLTGMLRLQLLLLLLVGMPSSSSPESWSSDQSRLASTSTSVATDCSIANSKSVCALAKLLAVANGDHEPADNSQQLNPERRGWSIDDILAQRLRRRRFGAPLHVHMRFGRRISAENISDANGKQFKQFLRFGRQSHKASPPTKLLRPQYQ